MAWSYLPHTKDDRHSMLQEIGVSSVSDLFVDIPEDLRLRGSLNLPSSLSEPELVNQLRQLAQSNTNIQDAICFLGAGAYDHYIPSVIDHIISRSEFYTAYTQYQPEISQGYLQALWEYQSMICEITGMKVANASLYDGGTAVSEAVLMACAAAKKTKVIVAQSVHPHYREVLLTYAKDQNITIEFAPYQDGMTKLSGISSLLDDHTAAIVVQSPNFFGLIENLQPLGEIAHAKDAYLIAVGEPISWGILENPGALGADIVVGEGQSLGMSLSFGGPYLGFFATTEKLMRKMPGRIVGQTTDNRGNRGFVLTLQAREQHIRRSKATSNICSNEALCALTAAVYMSAMGKQGFREVAVQCLQKAHYAYHLLHNLAGCEPVFSGPFFQEFTVKLRKPVAKINEKLLAKGILGGLDLGKYYPELENCMLLCVTEKRTKAEIDYFGKEMEAIL